ncbi:uncharacterized protein [Lepisosteus oculatus]|uniref:uncharacterized protein n=1 Tax=Lepisosteus oculatus TaxID=7918 RepID=UPI0035F50B55
MPRRQAAADSREPRACPPRSRSRKRKLSEREEGAPTGQSGELQSVDATTEPSSSQGPQCSAVWGPTGAGGLNQHSGLLTKDSRFVPVFRKPRGNASSLRGQVVQVDRSVADIISPAHPAPADPTTMCEDSGVPGHASERGEHIETDSSGVLKQEYLATTPRPEAGGPGAPHRGNRLENSGASSSESMCTLLSAPQEVAAQGSGGAQEQDPSRRAPALEDISGATQGGAGQEHAFHVEEMACRTAEEGWSTAPGPHNLALHTETPAGDTQTSLTLSHPPQHSHPAGDGQVGAEQRGVDDKEAGVAERTDPAGLESAPRPDEGRVASQLEGQRCTELAGERSSHCPRETGYRKSRRGDWELGESREEPEGQAEIHGGPDWRNGATEAEEEDHRKEEVESAGFLVYREWTCRFDPCSAEPGAVALDRTLRVQRGGPSAEGPGSPACAILGSGTEAGAEPGSCITIPPLFLTAGSNHLVSGGVKVTSEALVAAGVGWGTPDACMREKDATGKAEQSRAGGTPQDPGPDSSPVAVMNVRAKVNLTFSSEIGVQCFQRGAKGPPDIMEGLARGFWKPSFSRVAAHKQDVSEVYRLEDRHPGRRVALGHSGNSGLVSPSAWENSISAPQEEEETGARPTQVGIQGGRGKPPLVCAKKQLCSPELEVLPENACDFPTGSWFTGAGVTTGCGKFTPELERPSTECPPAGEVGVHSATVENPRPQAFMELTGSGLSTTEEMDMEREECADGDPQDPRNVHTLATTLSSGPEAPPGCEERPVPCDSELIEYCSTQDCPELQSPRTIAAGCPEPGPDPACSRVSSLPDPLLEDMALCEIRTTPDPPRELEDATERVCGVIAELSQLNRLVMSAHREMEGVRLALRRRQQSLRMTSRRGAFGLLHS